MKTMKLNIDLGKYVITGTKHDLILSERGIIKEGENAGKETSNTSNAATKRTRILR
ncbi:TPA: hypothetical protein JV356_003589 [Escherichia coli]|nr:hypothetical protein [Escherichia coli]